VFPDGSIESFRSRGAIAATRELEQMQDIDKTNDGLIDDAWKKEFYTNIPTSTKTNRRLLLKQMKEVYQAKGNENSFTWLFRSLYAKEDVEFYYPKSDMSKMSHGKWTLDKSIKILTSTANNIGVFTGKKITGASSNATGTVETAITSFAGSLEITELTLSSVVAGIDAEGTLGNFNIGEAVQTEVDANGDIALGYTLGTVTSVTVNAGGTDYIPGDEIAIVGGGGSDAAARVSSTQNNVIQTVTLVDAGDGYQINDPVGFIDEGTGGSGAAAKVGTIIKTSEVLINSEVIDDYADQVIGNTAILATTIAIPATSNSHLYGNSSLIFTAAIKSATAKYLDQESNFANSHLAPGDRIAKQVSIDETTAGQLTQAGRTVTFATGLTDYETRNVVGTKLTYANGNNTIITNFTSPTSLTVQDIHTIADGQNWDIYYKGNTHWGTIIAANSTQVLYAIGSYDRNKDLSTFSANNFSNNDSIIVYDANKTKAWAAKSANSYDSHMTHTGVTFDIGNTPASVTATTYTTVDALGPQYPTDLLHDTTGGFTMTTVNVGAIDTISMTTVGSEYATTPAVTISNNHINIYQNARDVLGVTSTLINVNLHSYDTGTITQSGSVLTLTSGTFPEANSGLNKITYANGLEDTIVTVTNTTSLIMSTERLVDSAETYTLTYGAIANNFTRNTFLYNDDFTARGRTLDFIDQSVDKKSKPPIATGNSVFRVHMLTAEDFGSVEEFLLYESRDNTNTPERLLLEDDIVGVSTYNRILTETSVEHLSQENGTTDSIPGDPILSEDGSTTTDNTSTEGRIYTEATTGDRVTAYSNATSTYTTGTITQSGTTVTGVGTVFPNDFVRGTITYLDAATSTITAHTNSTSFTVEDSKTIGSGQTYSISYNSVLTHGSSRAVTLAAGGTGNRTVTVTDSGHNFKTGSKVLFSNNATLIFNGSYEITNTGASTYTYTLPENTSVTSPAGLGGLTVYAQPVTSAYLATSNAVSMDTTPKGNNATLAVLSIATGSIKTVEVYNFGAGYTSAPILSAAGGNQDASFTANLGAFGEYAGYYTGTQGLLSGVPKIQDGNYYQDFSYVLKTDFDVNIYRNDVKRITHPSGMVMFGELAIRNKVSARLFDDGQSGTVDSLTAAGDGRRYHTIVLSGNAATANVKYKSSNTQPELEIYTAKHPWQAMNAGLATADDTNLLEEDYRDVTIVRTNSTTFTVTDTSHGLLAGDTIQIAGFPQGLNETDYWDGKYAIQTIITSNTYTVTPYRGDPGAGITADPYFYVVLDSTDGSADAGDNILTEHESDSFIYEGSIEYLKVETISFANVWLANTSNWDTPFNGSILDEAGDEVLLERGGSYLYPKLQFPVAETGTVSIDMSFNSDVLMEDHGYETGLSDSGYILTEDTGSVGTGPARKISLEEDTTGPDGQYESIPILDYHVTLSLLDSMRQGFLTEDGLDNLTCEDADPGGGGQASRLITERFGITDGSFAPVYQHTEHFSTSILGRMLYEDGDIIFGENTFGGFLTEITSPPFDKEIEFGLYDTVGWHLMMEDGSHIHHEDSTRALIEKLAVAEPEKTRIIDGTTGTDGYAAGPEIGDHHQESTTINDYMASRIFPTSTFGLQAFRPHYVSQWTSIGLGYVDDKFEMEDDTPGFPGVITLEHPVVNTDYLTFEEYPDIEGDIMNPSVKQSWPVIPAYQYFRVLTRLLGKITFADEGTTGTGTETSFTTQLRVGDEFQTSDENIIAEDTGGGILFESDERLEHETPAIGDVANIVLNARSSEMAGMMIKDFRWFLASEESTVDAHPTHSNVLGLYWNSLTGDNPFDPNLENYWLLTDDSYGRGRLELEDTQVGDVASFALTSDVLTIAIEDFALYLTKEDTVTATHSTHTNVQGVYTPYDNSGINDLESTWIILDEESNASSGNHVSGLETNTQRVMTGDAIANEAPEWTHNNMLWEDGQKQLITDPQAFIVGAIANTTSLTVTRKHLGGVSDSIYQM